ncbi:MAG: flagellar filament capping protein FliD, partial [Oscillibacter sp.]|nr:flagellar filament capping protein FliD [Oscillibacter sp.]
LAEATINTGYGTQKGSELINVSTDSSGNITFSDKGNRGANPYVSYLDSSMQSALGATESSLYAGSSEKKYTFAADGTFVDTKTVADYLSGKDISVTVDGVTKSFRLDKTAIESNGIQAALRDGINGLNMGVRATDSSNQLSFSAGRTSTFSISVKDEEAARRLGLDSGISNYLDAKSTIGNLLGSNYFTPANAAKTTDATIVGEREGTTNFYTNADTGIRYKKVTEDGTDVYYRVDSADKQLYELKINDKSIYVAEDASLESVLSGINNSDMGVRASYSKLTGSFVFTAKETGSGGAINFGSGLAERLFTANEQGTRTNGTDATVRALVNGELTTLTRASNTIDMDGMKVTLNGSFNEENLAATSLQSDERANALSFNTSSGSDDLMKTITDFVNDYNTVLKQLHDAYATQPAEKNSSSHTKYEPLTDDDKSSMSEQAIENYEAKAKQGILFGDSDLRAAYEALVRAISPGGNDGAALRNMGIDVTYSGGLTQIKLNESKLRDALAQDPDSVRDAFTKSKEYGASSDGLMTSIKETMDRYSSTSIASPGILVKKAGSTYSSSSLLSNAVQSQIDSVQKKIEQWQSKMSTKIDYYTRQFTALEKLMNTMNSQSSALAGLMGG